MRLALAVLAATLGGAGPAAAAELRTLAALPAAPGAVQAFEALPGGGAAVVHAPFAGAPPGDVTVDLARAGRPPVRRVIPRRLLVASAAAPGGRVDLLLSDGRDSGRRAPALTLVRVGSDGTRRIWKAAAVRGQAVLARSGTRFAVAWTTFSAGRVTRIRLATGTDRRGMGVARTVSGVLPTIDPDERFVGPIALTLSRGGQPTLAISIDGRDRPTVVLARTTSTGRIRVRQRVQGIAGRLSLSTSPGGRTAVLAEDTGIEDGSECSYDGGPRRIWAGIREPGSPRFRALQRLDELPAVCAAAGARLLMGLGDRVAVAWGTAEERDPDPAPPAVRLAIADARMPFGKREAALPRASLRGLAFAPDGGLRLFAASPAAARDPLRGPPVLQRRAPDGAAGRLEPLAPYVDVVRAAGAPDGSTLTLLRTAAGRLDLVAVR